MTSHEQYDQVLPLLEVPVLARTEEAYIYASVSMAVEWTACNVGSVTEGFLKINWRVEGITLITVWLSFKAELRAVIVNL